MLDALRGTVGDDELELVLNGDVFDFDAPRVIAGRSVFHDEPRDAHHTVPMLTAILRDHPSFVAALGRLLAAGHTVVVVSGNHDLALTLPEVRATLLACLVTAAGTSAARQAVADVAARVCFRAWFHRTRDGIVVEHGNQYDAYCSVRHPMTPWRPERRVVEPTLGSLAARHLVCRMGYFNPHVEGSYMLSAVGYGLHWLRYYLFSRHSLALAWLGGALRAFAVLFRQRQGPDGARREVDRAAAARETGASPRAIRRHARLFAAPVSSALLRAARELWLDRLALALGAFVLGLAVALVVPLPLAFHVAFAPVVVVLYQLSVRRVPLEANWSRVRRAARSVARVHRARAVVFGHTHRAEGVWERGVFFGNSGSWSAAYADLACTQPLHAERPVIWLRGARGSLSGGLVAWRDGRFVVHEPRPARVAPAAVAVPAEAAPRP